MYVPQEVIPDNICAYFLLTTDDRPTHIIFKTISNSPGTRRPSDDDITKTRRPLSKLPTAAALA